MGSRYSKAIAKSLFVLLFTGAAAQAQPEIEWQMLYGDPERSQEKFFAHIRAANGGWAFAGTRYIPGETVDFWLVVTEPDGNLVFEETYGDEDHNYA